VRRLAIIYNPASGIRRERRVGDVEAAARVFREAGVQVALVPSTAPRSASAQARELARSGCDSIIACGGDGTVNEVAQGILESGADTALGVIPLGTANALAAELRLPRNSSAAARALISAERKRIAVGEMEFRAQGTSYRRYWLTAASVGVDAELMYMISTLHKARFGMAAYFAGGLRLLLTHRFAPFEVDFTESKTGQRRREVVAYFLLARVANFGKMLRKVAPDAALSRDDASLILFKTRSRLAYIKFATAILTGVRPKIAGIESVQVSEVTADYLASAEALPEAWRGTLPHQTLLRAEVDGDVVGTLPVRTTIVPNALTMLVPGAAH